MADQTAIDVYERGKYSEDHRKHRDGDGDALKGSPIENMTPTRRAPESKRTRSLTPSMAQSSARRHR